MSCAASISAVLVAGFASGILLGFLFRNSDAERRQGVAGRFHSRFMRALYAPIWSLPGLLLTTFGIAALVLVLWAPSELFYAHPICGEARYWQKGALIAGVFFGWFLRYLLWRRYLRLL